MAENRKTPKQERGREAERNIIEAALTIFAEKGYAGARVSDIVRLSGSSTGSFYFRFKNKEALFDYTLDQYMKSCGEVLVQMKLQVPESLAELVYLAICRNVDLVCMNQGFYRAINEVSISNPKVWKKLQTLSKESSEALIECAKPFTKETNAPDFELAIRQIIQLVISWLANAAVHDPGPTHVEDPEVKRMLYQAAMGILQIHPVPDCDHFKS